MTNHKHIKTYKSKLRSKKVKYITDAGPYTTTHYVKVPFSIMPYFSRIKNVMHFYHIDNTWGDEGIRYDIIICCILIVKLDLKFDFVRQLLE